LPQGGSEVAKINQTQLAEDQCVEDDRVDNLFLESTVDRVHAKSDKVSDFPVGGSEQRTLIFLRRVSGFA
jgi:hypothetical protein